MPFRAELNYFYLYLQKYVAEKHGIRLERGDHRILTRALMEKVRDQIVEADVIMADVTGSNPNVFYEIGIAHALAKPVIFLTQEPPETAPVDVRQFEFIQYDLSHHEDFLKKVDNAIQNVFVSRYRDLYVLALGILKTFNEATSSAYRPASLEEFQARVMRDEQIQEIPGEDDREHLANFLLPKILLETANVTIMQKVMAWVRSPC